MKLPRLNIRLSRQSLDTSRIVQVLVGLVVLGYGAFLLIFLFQTVIRTVVFPKPIDPSQVSERQEKVQRALLETILEKDDEKHQPAVIDNLRNPFVP